MCHQKNYRSFFFTFLKSARIYKRPFIKVLKKCTKNNFKIFLHKILFQINGSNETFTLPAAQAFPVKYFGEMNVYIIETILSRAYIMTLVVGISLMYIIAALSICAHFKILAMQLENLNEDDPKFIENFLTNHLNFIEYGNF